MALGQTTRCPRVNRAKKFMCSPRNTGNINFSLWLTGGLSHGCPDFQKVYVFRVYVPFSCPTRGPCETSWCLAWSLLSPRHLGAIFDSQLPSRKLSPKVSPELSLSCTREGIFASCEMTPAVRVIARQLRDKNCLAAILVSRHQDVSSGPLGSFLRKREIETKFPNFSPRFRGKVFSLNFIRFYTSDTSKCHSHFTKKLTTLLQAWQSPTFLVPLPFILCYNVWPMRGHAAILCDLRLQMKLGDRSFTSAGAGRRWSGSPYEGAQPSSVLDKILAHMRPGILSNIGAGV